MSADSSVIFSVSSRTFLNSVMDGKSGSWCDRRGDDGLLKLPAFIRGPDGSEAALR